MEHRSLSTTAPSGLAISKVCATRSPVDLLPAHPLPLEPTRHPSTSNALGAVERPNSKWRIFSRYGRPIVLSTRGRRRVRSGASCRADLPCLPACARTKQCRTTLPKVSMAQRGRGEME